MESSRTVQGPEVQRLGKQGRQLVNTVRRVIQWVVTLCVLLSDLSAQSVAELRPPAVPLIVHDPYFSIWSMSDTLTDQPTRHWTGAEQPLTGFIRIDGVTYRYLGGQPRWVDPLDPVKQVAFQLTPTRTRYSFEAGGIRLDLTFLTPALADDLDILARPVTYLIWELKSMDGRQHQVKLYLDGTSHLVVDRPEQRAMWSRHRVGDMEVIRLGSVEQEVLSRSGDDLRIDWGYFYLAVPKQEGKTETLGATALLRNRYGRSLELPESRDLEIPPYAARQLPLIALSLDVGKVGSEPVSRHAIIAYDDVFSIEYFHRRLRPYWRRGRQDRRSF